MRDPLGCSSISRREAARIIGVTAAAGVFGVMPIRGELPQPDRTLAATSRPAMRTCRNRSPGSARRSDPTVMLPLNGRPRAQRRNIVPATRAEG